MSKDPKETIYAPEHIYIIKRPSGSFVSEWCIRPQKTGNLIYESIKYHHDSKYQEAQARIKELEEVLRFYADEDNWNRILKLVGNHIHLNYASLWKNDSEDGYTTARKYLEKESE